MTTKAQIPSRPMSTAGYAAGLGCLMLAIAASLILSGHHLNLLEVPGCGGDSPCNQAAASAWGKLPLVGWPLSLFGVAWFSALAAGWTAAFLGTGTSPTFRSVVRLGAAGSLVYVGAMIAGGYLCPYCLLVHTGSLAFLVVMERTPRTAGRTTVLASWVVATFVFVTGLELGADARAQFRVEAARLQSTQRIVETSLRAADPTARPFTGRYRLGPERAPIRVVIFSDYQCPFCRLIEAQARALVETRSDVSLSAKHYPMCTDCNRHTPRTLHPNACEAARVAETAGLIGGDDAFWSMHLWLFDRKGSFTREELQTYLVESNLNPENFFQVMNGDEPLARVKADVEEASALGLLGTPMLFINGVELKGLGAPEALRRAVEELAAMNLPARDATADRPPQAAEKHAADWLANPITNLSGGMSTWALGPDAAPVEVVVWGDYLTEETTEMDTLLRSIMEPRGDVRYVFRHFPINTTCNPISQRTIMPESCLAHKAAQVAGELDGEAGYWRMHQWLLSHQKDFDRTTLVVAAKELGFDPDALIARLDTPAVAQAVALDCGLAGRAGVNAVPFVFVNGRKVTAPLQDGVMEVVIQAAAARGPELAIQAPVTVPTPPPPSKPTPEELRAKLKQSLQQSGATSVRARLAYEVVKDPSKAPELERLLDEQGATQEEREALQRTMELLKARSQGSGVGP